MTIASELRRLANEIEQEQKADPIPPKPADQWYDGQWWMVSAFKPTLVPEVFWDHNYKMVVRCTSEASMVSYWVMTRKFPDSMTADELVKRDLKGAKATLQDGSYIVISREARVGGDSWWSFGWSGFSGDNYYAINRTSNAVRKPQDILSITFPTSHGSFTYRCEDGVCTRVDAEAEPWVPAVGDVVECIAEYKRCDDVFLVGDTFSVEGIRKGVCVWVSSVGISIADLMLHFRLVRRGGGK